MDAYGKIWNERRMMIRERVLEEVPPGAELADETLQAMIDRTITEPVSYTHLAMKSFEEPTSEAKAVRELLADEERYNKKIVNALIHGISILYPGVCVELSNGEKGLVITENEDNIFEPTVLDFRNNNLYDLSDPSVKQTIEIADVMKTMDNRIKLDKSLLEEYQAN